MRQFQFLKLRFGEDKKRSALHDSFQRRFRFFVAFKNAWIIHIRMGGSVVIVHERRKIDFTVSKAARYSIRAD